MYKAQGVYPAAPHGCIWHRLSHFCFDSARTQWTAPCMGPLIILFHIDNGQAFLVAPKRNGNCIPLLLSQ